MTQRSKEIRIPIVVDEFGNCFIHGWAHADSYPPEDYVDMDEQTRDMFRSAFQASRTLVTRWATIRVEIPASETEVEGVIEAE